MHIAIIGNGIAGITTARHVRKRSDCQITVISSETPYFFSRTALMYVYMGHMKFDHIKPYEDFFWEKNRIDLVQDYVSEINSENKILKLKSGNEIRYDKLVIASGSKPNKFGWPGENLKGVQGLYSYQDLQLLEENTHPPLVPERKQNVKQAVIVGGGLIGVELAEMLSTRNIHVVMLVRDSHFWGSVLSADEGKFIMNHMAEHGIEVLCNTELEEILSDDAGRAVGVRTKDGKEIACELVGLTTGVSPNIDFLKSSELQTKKGILVNNFLETNLPDIYALGDCAEFSNPPTGRKNIEQVWYTGRMMGEVLAETLTGNRKEYSPGPWFNSAKFFDIEYQTYGQLEAVIPDDEEHFFWSDPTARIALRLAWKKDGEQFIGINTFGIRIRHERMDTWLRQERKIDHILEYFNDALFDTEFYKNRSAEIVESFNNQYQKNIKRKKKS